MTDDPTAVDASRLETSVTDGRVSLQATVEDVTLYVDVDTDQLVEGFPVAELRAAGDDVEHVVTLNAEAVALVRDALAEVDRR